MDSDCTASADAVRAVFLADLDEALAAGGVCHLPREPDAPEALQAQLQEDLACLQMLQKLRPRRPGIASAFAVFALNPDDCAAASDERYEVVSLHATGGIGRVWRARDSTLRRMVALKDLHPDKRRQRTLRARFLREAQITGQLQHPGIVPVYELVRQVDAVPGEPLADFYTMRLIHGRTLAEAARDYHLLRLAKKATAVERIALLNAFVSACNTIAYAHDCGVIHRDLKGANVVLGDFGDVVVLDWGFAKVLDRWDGLPLTDDMTEDSDPVACLHGTGGDSHPSLPGQVMGTPGYMAPEQALGRIDEIDERTDVFGLGAILFEVLTGRPPFTGTDAAALLSKIRTESPPRPSEVWAGVPRILESICLKAMAHERKDRYGSVTELAREVQHWLADEPVQAFPERWTARLGRWSRRHQPTVAGAGALIFSGLIAIVVCVAMIAEERARASREQAAADARSRAELARSNYFQRIALAEQEIAPGNISRAIQYLSDCPAEQRGWEWHCLQRLCRTNQQILRGHSAAVASVAFSPDQRLLASASHDRTIQIRDALSGSLLRTIRGHGDAVYALTFSKDGCRLASASWDKTVKLWDPDTGALLMSLGPEKHEIYRLAMSPDGRYVAAATVADRLRIWDLESGEAVLTLTEPRSFFGLAFHPTAPGIIATSHDRTIRLWNFHNGAVITTLSGHHSFIKSLTFSSDGRLLASGTGDLLRGDNGEVRLWDVESEKSLFATGHSDPIYALAFSPNGRYLASAGQDKTVKLWDVKTGQEALTLRGHTDTVRSVAFNPQGERLASASADSTIRIWDAAPWSEESVTPDVRTLANGSDRNVGAVFSLDGRSITCGAASLALKTWDIATGAEKMSVSMPTAVCALAASPDGKYLATGDADGVVRLIDAVTGRVCAERLALELGPVHDVTFSPDSRHFAACGWWRLVKIWDVEGRESGLTLTRHSQPVLALAFDPKGRWLASAGYDQSIIIWDVRNYQPLRTLTGHGSRIQRLTFSPGGEALVSACHDGTMRLWNTTSWQTERTFRGHAAGVLGVAISPDGSRLASASDDWSIRVWSMASGEELQTLRGHRDRVHSIAYSPDGGRLASVSYDGTIKLWDVQQVAGR